MSHMWSASLGLPGVFPSGACASCASYYHSCASYCQKNMRTPNYCSFELSAFKLGKHLRRGNDKTKIQMEVLSTSDVHHNHLPERYESVSAVGFETTSNSSTICISRPEPNSFYAKRVWGDLFSSGVIGEMELDKATSSSRGSTKAFVVRTSLSVPVSAGVATESSKGSEPVCFSKFRSRHNT